MSEVLADLALFLNIIAAGGIAVFALMLFARTRMTLPPQANRETQRVAGILGGAFACGALDRLVVSGLGGINAYLLTHPDPNLAVWVVLAARAGVAVFVWWLVVYGLRDWGRSAR